MIRSDDERYRRFRIETLSFFAILCQPALRLELVGVIKVFCGVRDGIERAADVRARRYEDIADGPAADRGDALVLKRYRGLELLNSMDVSCPP
jgi:hypothetical protein